MLSTIWSFVTQIAFQRQASLALPSFMLMKHSAGWQNAGESFRIGNTTAIKPHRCATRSAYSSPSKERTEPPSQFSERHRSGILLLGVAQVIQCPTGKQSSSELGRLV